MSSELDWRVRGNCAKLDDPEVMYPPDAFDFDRHEDDVRARMRGACFVETQSTVLAAADALRKDRHKAEKVAKGYCVGCPVLARCLAYALQRDEYGVWGGMTRRERIRLLRSITPKPEEAA